MNDFENFHKLHKVLGDYWYSYFSGSEQVGTYINALVEMFKQVSQTCKETENSYSRKTIDVYRTVFNYPIKVKYSDFLEWSKVLPTYNGTYKFNGEIKYSSPVIISNRIKVPSNLVSVGSLTNRLTKPTITTTDIELSGSYLTLPFNPFKEDFVIETLPDKEEIVTVWLRDCKFDFQDLYTQFGYALGIKLESSQRYKDIINAFIDCLVNGGSRDNILQLIKAITGANGYIYSEEQNKDDYGIPVEGIVLPKGFLGECFKGDLVLKNEWFPTEVTEEDGFTRVDLPVSGSDAKKFNDLCFERGKEATVEVMDGCETAPFKHLLGAS